MDKDTAKNIVGTMSTKSIAHCIYLATVEGVSGAKMHDGKGFLLSAIAELWNIRGTVGKPNGKTKLTGRYKGMAVTEQAIFDVVSQYPKGFSGMTPLFDDLLESGGMQSNNNWQTSSYNAYDYKPQLSNSKARQVTLEEMQRDFDREDNYLFAGFILVFLICKFAFHFGWILSIVLGILGGGLALRLAYRGTRR